MGVVGVDGPAHDDDELVAAPGHQGLDRGVVLPLLEAGDGDPTGGETPEGRLVVLGHLLAALNAPLLGRGRERGIDVLTGGEATVVQMMISSVSGMVEVPPSTESH